MANEASVNTNTEVHEEPKEQPKKLYRLPKAGKIAGVCAGLADYLDIDVTLIRIVFVVLTLASGGFGLIVYLILAIVMPVNESASLPESAGTDIRNNANMLAAEMRDHSTRGRLRNVLGLGLVLLGLWLLLVQFFPQWLSMNWGLVWPALLIILGLIFVTASRR